jgi:acetylornithine deacetylase/succinyl-diaminopimelate desuccinylase family protein
MIDKILCMLDERKLIELLKNLIQIESHREVPEQEGKIADFISDWLRDSNIKVEVREVINGRSNVIGMIKGTGNGYSLMFNGHMDTVPIYKWDSNFGPFSAELREGKIFGRGSSDMKGGLAAAMIAMETIQKSNIKLKGNLVLTAAIGEEGSCSIGTKEIVRNGPRTDMAIVCEATNMNISIAQKGSCRIMIATHGKSAHTGTPEQGINAIMKMVDVIQTLKKELFAHLGDRTHSLLGSPRLTVAVIEGGKRHDVVPDCCQIQMSYRYLPGDTPEEMIKKISEILEDLKSKDPELRFEVNEPIRYLPWKYEKTVFKSLPMEILEDHQIVQALKNSIKSVTGDSPKVVGTPGWTDASILLNDGNINTVIYGPGGFEQAHSSGEYVEVEQVLHAAKIYLMTALNICLTEKKENK